MLFLVLALNVVLLGLMAVLLLRSRTAPADAAGLAAGAQLQAQVVAVAARLESVEGSLRHGMERLGRDAAEHAAGLRAESDASAATLRGEVERHSVALRDEVRRSIDAQGAALRTGLHDFRADNAAGAAELRQEVKAQLEALAGRLDRHIAESRQHSTESREALHRSLGELGREQREGQELVREAVRANLERLNADNSARLEEMRATVDEKLNATLNERLTRSFGQVTTHLGEVQKGLGEMRELATGVSDLKKVFSNVKARGVVGEFQLGMQLEQMFSRDQYVQNVAVRQGSAERVEYALRIPHPHGEKLFPIDSKFPREDWERLELAYEGGNPEEIRKAGDAFERAIRTEGKRICEKYIHEPVTLPHAILFLPTESLYAEVMRRPGLQSDLQQKCNVTVAGPATLMAILTSFRMGFHSIALEKKGNEVWKVLGNVKTEFGKFGDMMHKVERQVGTVQNTLGEIAGKTRTINRALRSVTETEGSTDSLSEAGMLAFEEMTALPHLSLVASSEGN